MKLIKKVIAWIACIVCCLTMFSIALPTAAVAAENINVSKECQLKIDYQYEGETVVGAEFHVYRVADISENGNMTLTGDFADYPVEINGLTDEEFQVAAETLYGYALLDELEPDYIVFTGEDGTATLEGLPVGVYLVAGQPFTMGDGQIICDPMLVSLPYRASEDSYWSYLVTIKPKCTYEENEEPLKIKVLKKWMDGGKEERPTSVTVYLLRDGEIYDTVVLSAENNWRHTWTDLDPDYRWLVVEQIPDDYFVTVQKFGVTYLIVNYRCDEEEPTEPPEPTEPSEPSEPTVPTEPSEPSEPTAPTEPSEPSEPTEPSKPSEPSEPTEPSKPSEPSEPTAPTEPSEPSESTEPSAPSEPSEPTEPEPSEPQIPQTGMTWWPVPLLAIAGLLLVIGGFLVRKSENNEA